MNKNSIALLTTVVVVGGLLYWGGVFDSTSRTQTSSADNVSMADGIQIIEITAKGGYQPRRSEAKAGVPSILRFNTSGTFDCSSSVRIPSMGISKNLPQSGQTDIDLGARQVGTLQGTCGMGMYRFEVNFQG